MRLLLLRAVVVIMVIIMLIRIGAGRGSRRLAEADLVGDEGAQGLAHLRQQRPDEVLAQTTHQHLAGPGGVWVWV